ncbi:helix-turn-helix transcriptional regulator [Hafnia psychrotolerans]|uniref:Transcriptional regulator n=1 Tax=Hafnia psychrotolerans TaxID=1477018 RepID=A0ABQ1H2J9_9GAMM|nr:LuxR C-terminal-related transcriptional regulator [Hafnia psychrotolerans]GGA55265.1 transcriptional regulator [Hafnia psychrotolerans]
MKNCIENNKSGRSKKTNVLIIEKCRYTRRGIASLISETKPDIGFITAVADFSAASEIINESHMDAIFAHVSQGNIFSFYFDSLNFTRSIKEKYSETKILVYTEKITPLFQIHYAADEFISTNESLKAWRKKMEILFYMPHLNWDKLNHVQGSFRITKEEWYVLMSIKDGLELKDISNAMQVSYKTVSALKIKALRKLGLKNKNELLMFIAGV